MSERTYLCQVPNSPWQPHLHLRCPACTTHAQEQLITWHTPTLLHTPCVPLHCRESLECTLSRADLGTDFFRCRIGCHRDHVLCHFPPCCRQQQEAGDGYSSLPQQHHKLHKPLLKHSLLSQLPPQDSKSLHPSLHSPTAREAATKHLPTACFHPSASQLNAAPRPYCAMTASLLGTALMAPLGWFRPRGLPR